MTFQVYNRSHMLHVISNKAMQAGGTRFISLLFMSTFLTSDP
jgi:hypothetical protein